MVQAGLAPAQARVVILGFTFKENCPDVRNTRVADIVHTLEEYGICPVVVDPCADKALVQKEYGVVLTDLEQVKMPTAFCTRWRTGSSVKWDCPD